MAAPGNSRGVVNDTVVFQKFFSTRASGCSTYETVETLSTCVPFTTAK